MGKISEESIRRVLEATDIVALIGSYVPLKKAGTLYKGCCPFHHEKTPSFTVSPSRQTFKCFGCGEGGSALTFVRRYENLTFVDAIRKLAEKARIHLVEEQFDPHEDRRRRERQSLLQTIKLTAEWYHGQLLTLPEAQKARDYLAKRGFSDDMIKNWQLGWAPAHNAPFLQWARNAKLKGKHLVDAGICVLRNASNPQSGLSTRFYDRLMFPICNDYGEIIAFSGRVLEEKANTGKYINSPETDVFRKSNVLFALNKARQAMTKHGCALVCEGQIDVIACHEAGFTHAVAPLGTALTAQHARLLRRYTTKALLCFDGDAAGIKAADKAFRQLAPEGIFVSLAALPEKDDPDSFIKREGTEAFAQFLSEAKSFFDAHVIKAQQNGILDNPEQRSAWLAYIIELVAHIPDPIYRDSVIANLSVRLSLGQRELTAEVQTAITELGRIKKLESQRTHEPPPSDSDPFIYEDDAPPPNEDEADLSVDENPPSAPLAFSDDASPFRVPSVDRPIQQLIELALQFSPARSLMVLRMEDLVKPLNTLRGGYLLKKVLASDLNPDDPASVQAFIESLTPGEAKKIRTFNLNLPALEQLDALVDTLISTITRQTLIHEQNTIVLRIKNPNLSPEEKAALFEELISLQKLLN